MRYNTDTCTIEMSVRSLCALAARSGDLDAASRNGVETMAEGVKIHSRLQAEAGGAYNAEVPLCNTVLYNGMYYTVSGRADGIIRAPSGPCVDEIKTVRTYEFFLPPSPSHMAQLKCYAYFFAVNEELEAVDCRMTYYDRDKDKLRYFNFRFSIGELREYYFSLLEAVSPFAVICANRELDALPSAAAAVFPYSELREGQELMIRECYGALKRSQRIFIEAPTGTGKTISSIFPAVRALGEKRVDRIFYLTAKASARKEAYAAAARVYSSGARIRAIVFNSKENMCRCPSKQAHAKPPCNPVDCPLARGYYDRLNGALLELLTSSNGYPASAILAAAERHGICPYELSLDLSEYCDVIICDYNYVFDPSVYLRRYFGDGGKRESYAFLIDEAHNLADRARDMYSAVLSASDVWRVKTLGDNDRTLDSAATAMLEAFSKARKLCRDSIVKDADGNERGFYMSSSPINGFWEAALSYCRSLDAWLKKNRENEAFEEISAYSSAVRKYICVNDYFDKGFLCYVELGGGDITVKTFCLDPSRVMDKLFERARSSVLFSATLTPIEYFADVLGCRDKRVEVSLPSPFDSDRLCVAVADYVSVRYGDRPESVYKYVSVIAATVSARAGNYIVYFPSYQCLEAVHSAFKNKYPSVETVVQKKNMRFSEKEEFLSAFKNDEGKLRVGFCVLGGAFSEGVDLPGTRLIGAIIIGVGLPALSNEKNIIRDYFEEDTGKGYDYAYTFPGMNNVLQAAGRVIRTDSDTGIVVLADDRYASPLYRSLFPSHWKGVQYAGNSRSLAEIFRRFWKNKG